MAITEFSLRQNSCCWCTAVWQNKGVNVVGRFHMGQAVRYLLHTSYVVGLLADSFHRQGRVLRFAIRKAMNIRWGQKVTAKSLHAAPGN